MFDSTLLKNMINSLIAEGKRNFAIDLTPLDYIYSDAINVILALNRRILDVSGRLSLMGPSPEVRQILERTGIQNILKIYETETDLLKSSEDIILQTTRYNLSDLQSYQQAPPPPKPKSEFEEFRSEISTAMSPGVGATEPEPDRGFRQPAPQQFAPPPPAYKEEEFEAAYKSFETEVSRDTFSPPPQVSRPQPQPQFTEPFTPPPVTPPPRPAQQPRKAEQEFAPVVEPVPTARRRDIDYVPPRIEPIETPSAVEEEADETFARKGPSPKAKAKPAETSARPYDDFTRDVDEEETKKKSPMAIIITALVVVVLAVGAYVGYIALFKGAQKEVSAPAPAAVIPPAVEKPVTPPPAEKPAAPPAVEKPVAPVAAPAPAPAVAEEPAEKPVKKAAAKAPSRRPAPEVSKKSSAPAEGGGGAIGKIVITSVPSGATIKADETPIGTTPFTWKNPNVIGEVTLVVSKPGYKDAAKTVEFTGGTKSESFRLEKEAAAPAAAKPAPAPAPEAAEPEAEPATPPSPKAAPAPAPEAAPAPAASSAGEAATVFIASIPPVADVYMDGKLIGKTNITKLNVTAGSHSMRFVKGTQEASKDMTFKGGDNPSQLVNLK